MGKNIVIFLLAVAVAGLLLLSVVLGCRLVKADWPETPMGLVVDEGEFPGFVQGPAIVEWWNGISQCGIFSLPAGETFSYSHRGHWWEFSSWDAMEARYSLHRAEFLSQNSCSEGRPGRQETSHITVHTPVVPAPSEPPDVVTTSAQGECPEHGTLAWHTDNLQGNEVYSEGVISGESETCWVVGQLWTSVPQDERWIFAIRPGYGIRITGHRSGSAWFFGGTEEEVQADLTRQADEVERRDGVMTTHLVIIPEDAAEFRLITEVFGAGIAPYNPIADEQPEVVEATQEPEEAEAPTVLIAEGELADGPASAPAIVEWYNPATGSCGIFALQSGGFSFVAGHWNQFTDWASLQGRYAEHKATFLATYPNCVEGRPE